MKPEPDASEFEIFSHFQTVSGASLGAFGFFAIEQQGVRVTKSVRAVDEQTIRLMFVIESEREIPVEITLSDQLPPSNVDWEPVVQPKDEEEFWNVQTDSLSCHRLIDPDETVEITHQLSAQHTDETAFYSRPVIEQVTVAETTERVNLSRRSAAVPNGNGSNSTSQISNGGTQASTQQSAAIQQISSMDGQSSRPIIAALPAYNEESMIGQTVSETTSHVDTVLVVNDGSNDETATRAAEAGAEVISHDYNRGYGATLQTIFTEARRRNAEHLVILDSDGQHDPSDIPTLIDTQRSTAADIVIGSRFIEGSETDLPRYRWLGINIVNLLTNVSMGVVRSDEFIRDTQSGFRSYNRRAIDSLAEADRIGEQMGASTDILHHAHREEYLIEEVGSTVRYDVDNPSSHNPLVHGYQLVRNILRTIEYERPILTLGFPGFVSTFAGLGLGYFILHNTVQTGTMLADLAVVSIFTTLVGLLFCVTSILLHTFKTVTDR
mgnify:CR=1 FL=1